MSKRVLSLIMVFAMCFSLLPAAVWADTTEITAEEMQNDEDTDDALSVVEDTDDVLSVDEDTALQSGEDGDVAVQASGHADHALCMHTGECSCPEDVKSSNAFTDATPLTWRITETEDGDLNYLYIDGVATKVSYNLGFRFFILPEGNYYLTDNLTLSYAIQIQENAKVNLCLNGYSVTKITDDSAGSEGVITIERGGTFSLCDCQNSGKITHKSGKIGRGVKGGNRGLLLLLPDGQHHTAKYNLDAAERYGA